jgi:Lin1244/Lin1753-like, N-terminal
MKWFKVDSDMPHDPKIRAVIKAMGPGGLGGLAAVWCHVAHHGSYPGRAIDRHGQPLGIEEIQDASLLPPDQFSALVEICLRTGHFDRAAWDTARGLWIPAMERRADRYTQRHLKKQQDLVFDAD